MFRPLLLGLSAFLLAIGSGGSAQARDRIEIVGSTIVGPFSSLVSERFARRTEFSAPRVQQTGSGGGFSLFCAGVGQQHPDIVGASRRIGEAELAICKQNGVRNITEIKIGYKAIVLATDKTSADFGLTRQQIFAAIAKNVEAEGKVVTNPYSSWHEIDASLPKRDIAFLAPAAGAELHDALVQDILWPACGKFPGIAAMKGREKDRACSLVRTDGRFQGFRENDPDLFTLLTGKPGTVGVLRFSTLLTEEGAIKPLAIDGVVPTVETIASGTYPPSRTLYLYTKNKHYDTVPGFLEFINEYTSEGAWGPDGYLVDAGLVPMSDTERSAQRSNAIGLNPMW